MRLKMAKACYEVVPSVIITPFVYQLFRMAVLSPAKLNQIRFLKSIVLAGMNYYLAILLRDITYWPIVAGVFVEVHRINGKRLYQT